MGVGMGTMPGFSEGMSTLLPSVSGPWYIKRMAPPCTLYHHLIFKS